MNRSFLLLASAGVVCAARTDARACSVVGPSPYVIDASMQATDHVAPTLQPLSVASLQRGTATGGACSRSSCDGMGSVVLTVPVSDDVTPAPNLGYRFSLAAGALPPSFIILLDQPSQVIVSDGKIWFGWDDGTEDHAPIDFTLRVVAIDRAGNESAPQTVRVTDDPAGCAVVRPHPRGLAWIVAAALLLARRRRAARTRGNPSGI
jgi:hypothetical protein